MARAVTSRGRRAGAKAQARPPAPVTSARVAGVDALRGIALLAMFVYHFVFDLRYYRVVAADFEHDPFWLGYRAVVVASFMTLVGMSLVLAVKAGATRAHFWRRVGVIAACALAASIGSWVMFPQTYIYFGILHAIAVASVVAAPFVRKPGVALAIGAAMIVAGIAFSHPAFDSRALSWIGFVTRKPATEDYVPLAPWAGFVFAGIALAHALAAAGWRPLAPLARAPAALHWLGRHSLLVYMLHQPIFFALLWVAFGR
jgi:uncharacterized membrane protein